MIVADVSVLAGLWLPSEWTGQAEDWLRRDPVWAVPLLWRSRFCEVLWTLLRREAVDMGSARQALEGAERLLRGREYSVPADRVLQMATSSGGAPGECEFVVLAEDLGVPLVTASERLPGLFPGVVRHVAEAPGRIRRKGGA